MNTFFRFFYEFISVFFDGLVKGFRGLWSGIKDMFSVSKYSQVIGSYKGAFNGNEKIFLVICIILILIILAAIGFLIYLFVKKNQYHPSWLNLLLEKWNQRHPTFILFRAVLICTSW